MRWVAARWVGTGHPGNHRRPSAVDGTWTAIDLGPVAVVAADHAHRPVVDLGDDPDAHLPAAVRRHLENMLSVTLDGVTVRHIVAELLTVHARPGRWPAARTNPKTGLVEVWCRELLFAAPPIRAATFSESFNQADSTVLGPDLTWTEVQNDWQTVSNRATPRTNNSGAAARAEHDLDTDNHYVGGPVRFVGSVSGVIGICARFSATAQTYYRAALDSAGRLDITRTVNGSNTDIASQSRSLAADVDYFVQLEASGSTIRAKVDSDVWLTVTDTQIVGNRRFGLAGYRTNRDLAVDWLTARDLGIGQAAETDLAQPIRAVRVVAVGQGLETDTAQPVGSAKAAVVGAAAEADTAQPIVAVRTITVAVASETATAQPVGSAKAVPVGQAATGSAARAVTPRKTVPVGLAAETGQAAAVTAVRTVTVGQPAETGQAQPITAVRGVSVGLAAATSTARPVTPAKAATVGKAAESDQATAVTTSTATPVRLAAETDAAQPVTAHRTVTVGQAAETDLAAAVAANRAITIGPGSETATAQPVTAHRTVTVGQASEAGQAMPVTVTSSGGWWRNLPTGATTNAPAASAAPPAGSPAAPPATASPVAWTQRPATKP